ncbi:hypothetical protein shim_28960 [Shimia sp. SK013]|uniref:hypothetical protein n=1 Tax=Shimia sp. SK013 TaxID=1389006 RepID=UPI0006B505BE|nr:hypothetical protein [Shimia sp. SK013]KPA20980.1 hypothetical protein shim_28960 [Shimia sp. SK013]
MNLILLFSFLGIAGSFAVVDGMADDSGGSDDDIDPGDEPTPDPDPDVVGTSGDDTIYSQAGEHIDAGAGDDFIRVGHDYSSAENDPITLTGGAGSDVFFIEDPSHHDVDRPFDIEITDFDPTEDALRLDLFDLEVGPWHENLLDISAASAEDGSFLDLHITMPGSTESADPLDFTIRLHGLADIDLSTLEIGEFSTRLQDDGTLTDDPLLADLGSAGADALTPANGGLFATLDGNDTVNLHTDVSAFVLLGDGDDHATISQGQASVLGGDGDDTFTLAHDDDRDPDTFEANLYGGQGDDTFVIEDARGDVTLEGGQGNDSFIAYDAVSGESFLRLSGGEGNDTYIMRMGQLVDEFHSGGDDTYTLVVTNDDMATASPANIYFNGSGDSFDLVVPDGLEGDVRVEAQPFDPDANMPHVDNVYVGDTLVAHLWNDFDGNFADSGASLTVTAAALWTAPGS